MMNSSESENIVMLLEKVYQREKQEKFASALLTSETLARLKLSLDNLPQKSQALLLQATKHSTDIEIPDTVTLSLRHSQNLSRQLEDDYEILKLKQKNQEVQRKIDRNKASIASLRKDLEEARQGLMKGAVNPRNVQDLIKQLRVKLASYEESCEKAKMKFSKLSVPEGLHPRSLEELAASLAALKVKEAELKEKADDIILARQLRDKLLALKR